MCVYTGGAALVTFERTPEVWVCVPQCPLGLVLPSHGSPAWATQTRAHKALPPVELRDDATSSTGSRTLPGNFQTREPGNFGGLATPGRVASDSRTTPRFSLLAACLRLAFQGCKGFVGTPGRSQKWTPTGGGARCGRPPCSPQLCARASPPSTPAPPHPPQRPSPLCETRAEADPRGRLAGVEAPASFRMCGASCLFVWSVSSLSSRNAAARRLRAGRENTPSQSSGEEKRAFRCHTLSLELGASLLRNHLSLHRTRARISLLSIRA